MTICCPLCDVEKDCRKIGDFKGVNEPFLNKSLVMCEDCKLLFINPMPSEELLDKYYKTSWLNDSRIVSKSFEKEVVYKIQAEERVKYLKNHIDLRSMKKMLDIGSGFGYFIKELKENTLSDVVFYAIDPCPEHLKRIEALGAKPFDSLDQVSEKALDFVSICFVLEHIGNTGQHLSKIRGCLKQGGYLFIDVPQRDDLFKPILEPHVVVFDKESLINLAVATGYELVHISSYGREQESLIKELKKGRSLFLKMASRLSNLLPFTRRLFLYRYFKFHIEGEKRWWIRAIFKKKDNQ